MFKKVYSECHINCGIAECNMVGIAATRKIPFVNPFAMFVTGQAFGQIRNSIGYSQLNVKIGATHTGIFVGEDGAIHQCNENFALIWTIPGMVVINLADGMETKAEVNSYE